MKTFKRSVVGVVATVLIGVLAVPAWATQMDKFGVGVVIPYAIYDDAGRDTVVGITAFPNTGTKIYWSFIDANGNLLASDFIPIVNLYVYSFSLSGALRGTGGAPDVAKGVPGYLIMIQDDDGTLMTTENAQSMAANAFLVNLSDFDALFLPVVPLDRTDLANSNINLSNFPPDGLLSLNNGHSLSSIVWTRFLTGPGGDPSTSLIVFTPEDAPSSLFGQAFGTGGEILIILQIPAVARRLNIIDVGSLSQLSFSEGYIALSSPTTFKLGFVFAFTRSSIVGAEQTIIGLGQ